MRLTLTLAILISLCSITSGQNTNSNTVIINKEVKTVPAGKKWILKANTKIRIQISDVTSQSGTLCNASFLSTPHIAGSIYKGDYHNSIGYGIFFAGLEKIPFTNANTYTLSPISFFDKSFTLSQLEYRTPAEIGFPILEFKSGERVFVGNCIEAIEVIEVNSSYVNEPSNKPNDFVLSENEKATLKRMYVDEPLLPLLGKNKDQFKETLKEYNIIQSSYSNIEVKKAFMNNDTTYKLKFDSRNICNEIEVSIKINDEKLGDHIVDSIKNILTKKSFVEKRILAPDAYGRLGYFNSFFSCSYLYILPRTSEVEYSNGKREYYVNIVYIDKRFKRLDSY